MRSFTFLEIWGKTPQDLGLPLDQLDPAWEESMILLKNSLEAERALHLET
ncbi:MAG TPA: hypothetical protein VF615_25550 [Longimicrobiaceae bacterium]